MKGHTRREFLKRAGVATAGLGGAALLCGDAGATSPPGKRPNILFIMVDQLAADVLSCYGGPVATPHIDRIAREGVRFTQATCVTPFCSPTRASVATGMYPHSHGVVLNAGRGRQDGITAEDVTTERLLYEAGYATHHYGKWHLEGDRLGYYPDMFRSAVEYRAGMADVFARVGREDPARRMSWYAWALPVEVAPEFQKQVDKLGDRWKDKRFAEFITKMGRLRLPLEQCFDVQVADETCKRLKKLGRAEKPFMVTCSFVWPHDPNVVPSPYYEMFDPAEIKLPANRFVREERFEKNWSREIIRGLGEVGLREFLRIYYGMVKLIDDQVGRVMKVLEETGKLDETIVVFTADHGDMTGGHGMVWKSTNSFYEEVVKVPLMIRYPRRLRAQVSDLAVDSTDFMPTLLELTCPKRPIQMQGQSLVPFLTGQKDASTARRYTFAERLAPNPGGKRKVPNGAKGDFMVRGQGWKFMRYRNGDEYMYNLVDDPGETKNVAGDAKYKKKRLEMVEALNGWFERTGCEWFKVKS